MGCKPRRPEGGALDMELLPVFSKVAGWTGASAALRVRRILGVALSRSKRMVDIGTGPATIPMHIKRHHPQGAVIGVDISWQVLSQTCHLGKATGASLLLTAGDGQCLPFGDNTFDIVTCFFALHHMDHPRLFFQEADRVLRSDGSLLVIDFRRDMPLYLFGLLNGLWRTIFCFSKGRRGFAESVRSAWCPAEIKQKLAAAGLSRFKVHANPMELWVINAC